MIYHDISIVSLGFNNQFIGDISIVSMGVNNQFIGDISIVSMGFNNQFIGDISIVSIYKPYIYIYNHIANGGHHQTFDHSQVLAIPF